MTVESLNEAELKRGYFEKTLRGCAANAIRGCDTADQSHSGFTRALMIDIVDGDKRWLVEPQEALDMARGDNPPQALIDRVKEEYEARSSGGSTNKA